MHAYAAETETTRLVWEAGVAVPDFRSGAITMLDSGGRIVPAPETYDWSHLTLDQLRAAEREQDAKVRRMRAEVSPTP